MANAVEIVSKFYDVCNNKQGQDMRKFISDDMMFEGPVMKISGGNKYVEVVEPLCKFHKGMRMLKQFSEGDHVLSIYEMTIGTPSGESLRISFADWIRVADDRITEQRLYYDPRKFIKAFNL